MMEDILVSLSDVGALSKRQKKVAEYIYDNFDTAAFMTAEHLAEAANVSESTVIRFASEMGFDSFSELRRALQDILRSRIGIRETQAETVSTAALHEAIIKTERSVREADDAAYAVIFDELCTRVKMAQRICISGQGRAYALAQYAAASLCELRSGITVLHAYDAQEAVCRLEPSDMLIDISVRDSGTAHISAAADKGVCVAQLVIGDFLPSVRSSEIFLRISSTAAAVMLIDALCTKLSEV